MGPNRFYIEGGKRSFRFFPEGEGDADIFQSTLVPKILLIDNVERRTGERSGLSQLPMGSSWKIFHFGKSSFFILWEKKGREEKGSSLPFPGRKEGENGSPLISYEETF